MADKALQLLALTLLGNATSFGGKLALNRGMVGRQTSHTRSTWAQCKGHGLSASDIGNLMTADTQTHSSLQQHFVLQSSAERESGFYMSATGHKSAVMMQSGTTMENARLVAFSNMRGGSKGANERGVSE